MGNFILPCDHKREQWRLLEGKHTDTKRMRQLELDAREVRNEMILQDYYWEGMTCKDIGDRLGLDESTVYRVVSTRQPVPPDDYDEWLTEDELWERENIK